MPVTSSAKRALRKDRRRTITNNQIRSQLRSSIKKFKSTKDKDLLPQLYTVLDRASKKNIIHPNKAARLKSQYALSANIQPTKVSASKPKVVNKTKTVQTKKPAAKKKAS